MSLSIPSFYLYGEPHRQVDEGFVHAEAIDDRSRPSEWTIHPHAHADLAHVFVLTRGGGAMQADAQDLQFTAPCLMLVPSTVVHGFRWHDESEGWVLTMATRYAAELTGQDSDLARVFDAAVTVALDAISAERVEALVRDVLRELGWQAPGYRSAVSSALLSLLVTAVRHQGASARAQPMPGAHVSLVARLRQRIEQRFRLREPVSEHARALGTSETVLRLACTRVANTSPMRILDERAVLEARRALLYSNLTIAEVGDSIGIADPAYFSRFFQRKVGLSPKNYREQAYRPVTD